ncbi:MAG: uridine kinase family protein, partial [Candidatus Xenobia bacterium]
DLQLLERQMAGIVEANEPIVVHDVPVAEGLEILRSQGLKDTVAALQASPPATLRLHRLGRSWTFSLGPLLPYAGMPRPFALQPYLPGLILRFPILPDMDHLPPFVDQPRLFAVFHEHQRWCSAMGVRDLADLNGTIQQGGGSDLIKMQESLHEKRIAAIADDIASRRLARVVLVAGPSSSGKTTFTKRLAIHLRVNGLRPLRVELDHYFRNACDSPRDASGEADFEHLDAIDVPLFNQHLLDLVAGRQIEPPLYDFKTGCRSSSGNLLQLGPDQILLLEGIHGLNEALTPTIPASMKYRIYVSALTHASLDDHNRLSTHDVRLLRRILRDQRDRGYSPEQTLHRWPSVVAGEEKWIFPFQEGADVMFNSALVYEISAVAPLVLPLLESVPRQTPEFAHAAYLARILRLFVPLHAEEVPPTSILREFVGGSSFR